MPALTKLAALAMAATLAVGAARPASAQELHLRADLSERRITILMGDDVVRSYTVAIGTDRYPTPTGRFMVRKIVWNPGWVPPDSRWARNKSAKKPGDPDNPMKLVKIFFKEPDYYIHGTGALETLGDEASHGCLRMEPDAAAEIARYLMTHGGEPRPESWFRRIFRFRSKTQVVYLQHPIPMEIAR
jgi:lipoprotein-anchoring transpeptidase ErfK/SrfK